jgi:hypothetical protein
MALVVADRVRETTTTTGTGTYTLAGAVGGYQSFASAASDADTVYYAVTNDTDWEIGIGTLGGSGTTLARTTILQSSNSDSAVSWGAGAKQIFLTYPAERAVYMNGDGTTSDFFDAAGSSTPRTSSTGSAVVPTGTEAQRDGSPSAGYLRFNSDATSFEGYDGSVLGVRIGGGATSDAIYENSATISENITIATGRNGMSTGPISVAGGVTVTVESGARYVVI